MAAAMKIRKGDLVHMIAGKDRGKQGRVIEARPRDRRVIVENLNVVKRHMRPAADARLEPHGRRGDDARRRDREGRRRSRSRT